MPLSRWISMPPLPVMAWMSLLLFETNNIHDYMIEIGGEVRTAGLNAKGEAWTIGISKPVSGAQVNDVVMPIAISNKSLATSGNYRNFYEKDQFVWHIIDPERAARDLQTF